MDQPEREPAQKRTPPFTSEDLDAAVSDVMLNLVTQLVHAKAEARANGRNAAAFAKALQQHTTPKEEPA